MAPLAATCKGEDWPLQPWMSKICAEHHEILHGVPSAVVVEGLPFASALPQACVQAPLYRGIGQWEAHAP